MSESLKYDVVKQYLLNNIQSGKYRNGALIPSERDLMEIFNVSRTTVRKAIDELEREQRLERIQGKGTFVRSTNQLLSHDLFSLTSCTEDIENKGKTVRRKVLSQKVVISDEELTKKLALSKPSKVMQLIRVYYADDTPLNLTESYLPLELFPTLMDYDFGTQSLYKVLETVFHTKIVQARRYFQAILCDEETAFHLETTEGMPLIRFLCHTYGLVDGIERPIEYFICQYRTDKFQFFIDQVRKS